MVNEIKRKLDRFGAHYQSAISTGATSGRALGRAALAAARLIDHTRLPGLREACCMARARGPIGGRVVLGLQRLAAAAAAVLLSVSFAAAEEAAIVTDVSGEELEQILQVSGFAAELTSDGGGNPAILAQLDAVRFIVRTFGCSDEDAPRCDQLLFFANFELGREVTADDFRTVNTYNDSNVFGRGYVLEDSNRVGVDLVVNLRGGVTVEHFMESLRVWVQVLGEFADDIDAEAIIS